jgi:alpha-methylacyl-CoA racemase
MGQEGDPPPPPLNLVGDYGGGALYLVVGLLAGILNARRTGIGQVVDAAMCDGAASLMTHFFALHSQGRWTARREDNLLDGGAPFYRTYRCADGRFVAVGPIEAQFFAVLRDRLGHDDALVRPAERQGRVAGDAGAARRDLRHPHARPMGRRLRGQRRLRTPVLDLAEAPRHPHFEARGTFSGEAGGAQPSPAPRFSRTPSGIQSSPALPPTDPQSVLRRWTPSATPRHEETLQ